MSDTYVLTGSNSEILQDRRKVENSGGLGTSCNLRPMKRKRLLIFLGGGAIAAFWNLFDQKVCETNRNFRFQQVTSHQVVNF